MASATLKGILRGVNNLNEDISVLHLEVQWHPSRADDPHVKEDFDLQFKGMDDALRGQVWEHLQRQLSTMKQGMVVQIPLPVEEARKFGDLVGREVEAPFEMTATDLENLNRTGKDAQANVRSAPSGMH